MTKEEIEAAIKYERLRIRENMGRLATLASTGGSELLKRKCHSRIDKCHEHIQNLRNQLTILTHQ